MDPSPRARGVYSRYTLSRDGIIDLSHDVDVLEATESSKKLAACNFDRAPYILLHPRAYIPQYTPVVFFQVRLHRGINGFIHRHFIMPALCALFFLLASSFCHPTNLESILACIVTFPCSKLIVLSVSSFYRLVTDMRKLLLVGF